MHDFSTTKQPPKKISYVVLPDKAGEVKAFCDALRKKFPKMKSNRIKKKAAAYFHLKQRSV